MLHMPRGFRFRKARKNADPLVGSPYSNRKKHFMPYFATGARGLDLSTIIFKERLADYSLYVSGFIFDKIEHVGVLSYGGVIPADWVEEFATDWKSQRAPVPDEFWRTLVADRGHEGPLPAYYRRVSREVITETNMSSGAINVREFIESGQNVLRSDFCRRVIEVVWSRRMMRTNGGRLGIARKDIQKGDVISILYGCSVPVIRKQSINSHEGSMQSRSSTPV
jgi:hypothetical protein